MVDRPDLVISIDFALAHEGTGVAYCNVAAGNEDVRHIQRWPGRMMANENKVPTLLMYPRDSATPSSWGFLAETAQEQSDSGDESREWFKILLDEHLLEQIRKSTSDPSKVPSIHEVERLYTDYFRFLHRTIESRLKTEIASSWEDAKIEFIFSVPTTWKPNPTVERFRNVISRAGFGQHCNHSAVIGLTEAEAAAVHTARNTPAIFKENEILFVCDVGGGTTDLSLFRVKDTTSFNSSLKLEQIDVVFGATIGSVQLDNLFEKAVLDRLEAANRTVPMELGDLQQTAWEMRICKEYQNAKCDYGSDESFVDTDSFSVRIPHLARTYVNDQFGIRSGEMLFRRDDLRPFFDAQITKLFDMIDKQLVRLRQKLPNEEVAHMVLSGGLGNSAYVRDQLCNRYGCGNSPHLNARNLQIRVAPDPQLVVCKGIVVDRVQKLKSGQYVLGWRCSRSSYGLLCKVKHDPNNPAHHGLNASRDPLDGQLYITDYIDWFIKQGEPVSRDFRIVRPFTRKCSPATPTLPNPPRVFPTDVVSSDVDKRMLPITFNSSCRHVCKVHSDFSSVPLTNFKLKNRHWYSTGPKYHRIDFVVKVNIGPADIGFELWHQGIKLSKDQAIKVEWVASPPPAQENPVPVDFPISSAMSAKTVPRKGLAMGVQNPMPGFGPVQMNQSVGLGYGAGQMNQNGYYQTVY